MKCYNVGFSYRGKAKAGHALAEILSEISVQYDFENGSGSFDLGSLLRESVRAIDAKAEALAQPQPAPIDYGKPIDYVKLSDPAHDAVNDPEPLMQPPKPKFTERQRIVAFIAARLYPHVYGDTLQDRNRAVVSLSGQMLDEVVRQNP